MSTQKLIPLGSMEHTPERIVALEPDSIQGSIL